MLDLQCAKQPARTLAVCALSLALSLAAAPSNAVKFTRNIGEIQVRQDSVRVYIGPTYGTCGSVKEGWVGWHATAGNADAMLSLLLTAKALDEPAVFDDPQSSCAGGPDYISIEGLYLPD